MMFNKPSILCLASLYAPSARSLQTLRKLRAALLIVFLLIGTGMVPAWAQIPGLPDLLPKQPSVTNGDGSAAKRGPIGARVVLGGDTLFRVYAEDPATARDRADLVALRLQRALAKLASGEAQTVTTAEEAGAQVVRINGEAIITVTAQDTSGFDDSAIQVASEWSSAIEEAFAQAERERGPGFLRQALIEGILIILFGIALHLGIWFLSSRYLERPGLPALALLWALVLYRLTDLLPQTRPLHYMLSVGVLRPLAIVGTCVLAASALSRVVTIVLRRIFPPLPDTLSAEERTERTFRRRATLGNVARVTAVMIIWFFAFVTALSWVGVNIPALIASAGLIGVALGLAAQDTMKDIVAGINILADDRFGVGDVIRIGEYSGKVETINLRITQIRDTQGQLITVPNRTIETVANMTSRWSQVDFTVAVSYETDLREALRILEETANALREEWPDRILAEPDVLGADSLNDFDITLRMLLRTAPGDQWAVARELRIRVKDAFDRHGIVIPLPQSEIIVGGRADVLKPSPAEQSR